METKTLVAAIVMIIAIFGVVVGVSLKHDNVPQNPEQMKMELYKECVDHEILHNRPLTNCDTLKS